MPLTADAPEAELCPFCVARGQFMQSCILSEVMSVSSARKSDHYASIRISDFIPPSF